jgi:F0F1-type ATP synthase alpha subunit
MQVYAPSQVLQLEYFRDSGRPALIYDDLSKQAVAMSFLFY